MSEDKPKKPIRICDQFVKYLNMHVETRPRWQTGWLFGIWHTSRYIWPRSGLN